MRKNPEVARPDAKISHDPKVLRVVADPEQSRPKLAAKVAMSSSAQAMKTNGDFLKRSFGELDITELHDRIVEKTRAVAKGDLSGVEAMLVGQAESLQAIFTDLAGRAALNAGQYINATDTYLRLALKAQAQCRATLETLAEIKNPRPVAFIKQQNNANGPQQVNNGTGPARTENPTNQPNEQLAVTHEQTERLDLGTPAAAGRSDPAMEAVGAVNGADHARR